MTIRTADLKMRGRIDGAIPSRRAENSENAIDLVATELLLLPQLRHARPETSRLGQADLETSIRQWI
jgi:hypothetical protein